MKLFQKENTADTKLIYQSFPFPNCNTSTGNSVLNVPAGGVITNHYNRSYLSDQSFGSGAPSGRVIINGNGYYFFSITVEEEIYGLAYPAGSPGIYLGGWGMSTTTISQTASYITNLGAPAPNDSKGWLTRSPIINGKTISGIKLHNVETVTSGITVFLDIITYNHTTNAYSILQTTNISTQLLGTPTNLLPVLPVSFTFVGDGVTHIGFSLRTSNTNQLRSIGKAITIIH